MDCRVIPTYSCEQVITQVEKIAKTVEKKYGVKITYEILQKAQSVPTPADSKAVTLLSKALKEPHGIDSKIIGIGGGTVGAELRNEGFNCVVWGTLDERCHMQNEYCVIDNLVKDAQTLAVLIAK